MNHPLFPLGGIGEDVLMGNTLFDDDLPGFYLPVCIYARDEGEGEQEEKEEEDGEKYSPHRFRFFQCITVAILKRGR